VSLSNHDRLVSLSNQPTGLVGLRQAQPPKGPRQARLRLAQPPIFLLLLFLFLSIKNINNLAFAQSIWTETSNADWSDGVLTNTTWYPNTQIQLDWQGSSGGASTPTVSVPWLEGWKFRRRITINNSLSYGLSDYQVWIPTSAFGSNWQAIRSSAQPTMADFRFTPSTSTNTLPYWIEDNTTTPKGFWVRISTVLAGNNQIYMYYGNLSVSSASNGTSTFIFFDDFGDGILDTTNIYTLVDGSWSETSGVLKQTQLLDNYQNLYIKSTTFPDNIIISVKIKPTGDDGYALPLVGINSRANAMISGSHVYFWQRTGTTKRIELTGASNVPGDFVPVNSWTDVSLILYNSTYAKGLTGEVERINSTTTGGTNPGYIGLLTDHATAEFDNIRVRKYAPTEPTISSLGSEEGAFFSSGTYRSNVLDCGSKVVVSSISWNPSSQPAGTSISVGIRVSSYPFSINSSTPAFVGVFNGQSLNWQGRYVQYISTFTTNYSTSTPRLEDISIVYRVKPWQEKSITRSGKNSFGFGGGESWGWQVPVKSGGSPLTISCYVRYNSEYQGSIYTKPKLTLSGKGISTTSVSASAAAENAWELLTINAGTPSQSGMLNLKAEGFSNNPGARFYIDDIQVSQ